MANHSRNEILEMSSRHGDVDPSTYLMFSSAENIETLGHAFGQITFLSSELNKFLPIRDKNKNEYTKKLEKAVSHLILNPEPKNAFVCAKETCHICGEDVSIYFDGEHFSIKDECKEKREEYSFDIAIPSGKICFANDFRSFFPDVDHYVNHFIGMKNTTRDYAKYGMFHPFVGNTCPTVIKRKSGIIEIGQFKGTNHICTDLWWVSACDSSILKQWVESSGNEWTHEDDFADFTIKVKPGIYRCTTRPRITWEDDPYCKMELISEEIPEGFTLLKDDSEVDTISDFHQSYLNSSYYDMVPNFKTAISFFLKDTSERENDTPWFKYNFSSEDFNKEIINKYPSIDDFDHSELTNLPVFKNKIDAYHKVSNGQEHFNCKVEDFMKYKSYNRDYTVFTSIMLYSWNVLNNSNIKEHDIVDAKRIISLCIINLKERGLFEKAISWIENLRYEIENESENPKIKQEILNGMNCFKNLLKSYEPDIDVNSFIKEFVENHKKERY